MSTYRTPHPARRTVSRPRPRPGPPARRPKGRLTHPLLNGFRRRSRPSRGSSTRVTHRLGPLQLTLSHRPNGLYLRISIWGTGLAWEQCLWRRSRRRET